MTDMWELTVVLLVAVDIENDEITKLCRNGLPVPNSEQYFSETPDTGDWRLEKVPKKVLELRASENLVISLIIMKLPSPGSGADAAANFAARAIEVYQPHTVCMVGMCAGSPCRTDVGDVILASTIVRHDYGELRKKEEGKFEFDHFGCNPAFGINGTGVYEYTDFKNLLKQYNDDREASFRVKIGAFSSGNQHIKIDRVFDYLHTNIIKGIGGDEGEWRLLALDMEAFSVAYAAKQSSEHVGCVVVKGVADAGDSNTNKLCQPLAVRNALDFFFWFLPRVVQVSFKRTQSKMSAVLQNLTDAKNDYQRGDFERSCRGFTQVYKAGCRSDDARKHYIKCLMRYGDYDKAINILEAYLRRPWSNDDVTVGLLAEIYWRRGEYKEMQRLLDRHEEGGAYQIPYLKALFLISDPDVRNAETISKAVTLLRRAIGLDPKPSKFFLNVNLCFALRLQRDISNIGREVLDREYGTAISLLDYELNRHPNRGLLYVYKLLLLAVVGETEGKFSNFIESSIREKRGQIVIALDNVDMIYKRIHILYEGDKEKFDTYVGGLTKFIMQSQRIGKVIREDTGVVMHANQD